MRPTVRELTTAIASGDTEAFAQLYRERFDAMLAEARRCTSRDESFCLDVVQDAMMKVIHSLKPLNDERQLAAWLRTTVQRCALDRLRAEARRRRREAQAASTHEIAAGSDSETERITWLGRQIDRLEPAPQRLITLRYRFGWTLQQIASSLGLKPGAVDGRINRTLAALRRNAMEEFHE